MIDLNGGSSFNFCALRKVLNEEGEMSTSKFEAQLAAREASSGVRIGDDEFAREIGMENVIYRDVSGDIFQQLAMAYEKSKKSFIEQSKNNVDSEKRALGVGLLHSEVEESKAVCVKEGPKMGEGGNWKCEYCNNINYSRRKSCNRCKAPRMKENDMLVAEFNRVKEGLQSIGFDGITASSAAAAQQAASNIGARCLSELNFFHNENMTQNSIYNSMLTATPKSTRTTTTTGSASAQSPYSLPLFLSNGLPNASGGISNSLLCPATPNCVASPYLDTPQGFILQGLLEQLPMSLGGGVGNSQSSSAISSSLVSPSCVLNGVSPLLITFSTPSLVPQTNAKGFVSDGMLPPSYFPLHIMLLKAKDMVEKLLVDFQNFGDGDPTTKSIEVLKAALAILGHHNMCECEARIDNPDCNNEHENLFCSNSENFLQGLGGPHFAAPAMLAHPDEFKNPSSFLKIYGDPLCKYGISTGHNPLRGQNGNWCCGKCKNVNFPRRFRCNKCSELRDDDGDRIVAEYAKSVYHQHNKAYKNCLLNNYNNSKIMSSSYRRNSSMNHQINHMCVKSENTDHVITNENILSKSINNNNNDLKSQVQL